MRSRVATAAVLSAGLLAACAAPVDDIAEVRITELVKPSVSLPAARVLPTVDDLAATFGAEGFMGQLVDGGPDALLRGVAESEATPGDCVGVAYRLQQVVYADSAVQSVASQTWAGGSFDGPPMSGFFGAVKFTTPVDAQAFFAASAEKWRRCNGQTVVLHQRAAQGVSRISDVVVDEGIVSAVVMSDGGSTTRRALGVASDYVVDVEVNEVGGPGGAIEVANLMLHKLG